MDASPAVERAKTLTEEVRQLLEGGAAGAGPEQTKHLAEIRARLWLAQKAILEEEAAIVELQRAADRKLIEKKDLEGFRSHLDRAIQGLQNYRGNYEDLDLVDVDEFAKDNPEIAVDTLSPVDLMSARIADEERRRTLLFGQRMSLQGKLDDLRSKNQRLKSGLRCNDRTRTSLDRAVYAFEALGEYFVGDEDLD